MKKSIILQQPPILESIFKSATLIAISNLCKTCKTMMTKCREPFYWEAYIYRLVKCELDIKNLGFKPNIINMLVHNAEHALSKSADSFLTASINVTKIFRGNYVLHNALHRSHFKYCKALVNLDKYDKKDGELLDLAIKKNHEIAEILIKNGICVNFRNWQRKTPLMLAIDNPHMVKLLINYGADLDNVDHYDTTALSLAIGKNYLETINILINAGANINLQDSKGITRLMHCISKNKVNLAKLLINSGADLNLQDNTGKTALMIAIYHKNIKLVKFLISKGADLNLQDNNGVSALMIAISEKNVELVQFFIKSGANINHKNAQGNTPLMWAVNNNSLSIVRLLIFHGSEINAQDNNGITALMSASEKGHLKILKVLINAGTDIHIKSKSGNSALLWAVVKGRFKVVKILLNSSDNINVTEKDNDGDSPLNSAIKHLDINILNLLKEYQTRTKK